MGSVCSRFRAALRGINRAISFVRNAFVKRCFRRRRDSVASASSLVSCSPDDERVQQNIDIINPDSDSESIATDTSDELYGLVDLFAIDRNNRLKRDDIDEEAEKDRYIFQNDNSNDISNSNIKKTTVTTTTTTHTQTHTHTNIHIHQTIAIAALTTKNKQKSHKTTHHQTNHKSKKKKRTT